ncbi:uncharacterized protein LOC119585061 [Penaeus monodon]|uniref:uncharacterized protein LOC119585061 n=1 Tax=Penaeus monodon TaxID=6687 RepID=UPI0018A766B0|nr:uncharacterized protein LOC119585061 [Penaeus monodon]
MIIVPDEYLTSDVLMGADMIGKAKFTWNEKTQDLYWGEQQYKIYNTVGRSINMVEYREGIHDLERKNCKLGSEKWLHINHKTLCPPGKVTYLRITHKDFQVGQIIRFEKMKSGKLSKLNGKILSNGYVIDEQKGFDMPVIHLGKRPIKFTPGSKIGEYTVIDEEQIIYLDLNGVELGNKVELAQTLLEESKENKVMLCGLHCHILPEEKNEKVMRTSIEECRVCCRSLEKLLVGNVGQIDNSLVPHSETVQINGDRRTRLRTLIKSLDWKHLTEDQQELLTEVILDNNELVILDETELGRLKVAEAHIPTVDNEPIRMPLYRYPEQSKKIIADMIQNMMERGVIEESTAAYLSPIVLAGKPDGSKRMYIDFRAINKKIKMDVQPLPRLAELVEESAGRKLY